MNYKKIILNALFIIAVPTVLTVSYYGIKGIKKYMDKKKAGSTKPEDGIEKDEDKTLITNNKPKWLQKFKK